MGRKSIQSRYGFTLVEVLLVVVVLTILLALILPAFGRARRQERVELCAAHLKTLHQAQLSHYARAAVAAPELGGAYWGNLGKTSPPLVQPETLTCPLDSAETPEPIQYLGPAVDPRTQAKDVPIGCDRPVNHSDSGREGGNVLMKSGSVVNDNTVGEAGLWGTAAGRACRP